MPSTFTLNNGIELIATGEQTGSWGDSTNIGLQIVDRALDGQVTVTLGSAGTSGSPNTLAITDGALSDGQNRLIIYADGGDLGATAYVQLTPADSEKIVYIRNNLSGSRGLIVFQGTYNASNDYEIPAGTTAVIFFDGAGAGAVAANVFNNAYFDSLRLGGVSVTAILDEDNMASDSATALVTQQSIKAYVDAQVTAQDLDFAGGAGTGAVDLDSQTFTIAGTADEIDTTASGQTLTVGIADNPVLPGTGAVRVPAGTTAERTAGTAGDFRFNNTFARFEGYTGTGWQTVGTAASISGKNKIINGAMQVAQRGTNFAGGTLNADDAYTLDRWYVLSEGSDSVDVDQIADSPDTGGKCIRLDVETVGEKFGIAQIVEAVNCTGLIGNTVTLSFSAKVSNARLDTIKAAVVAWSGTADAVTSDIVSTWNADGTTPTLIANATFENTPADLGVTTDWARYTITADVDTASTSNIIVFIWSDDATNPLAGDFLYVTNVQLEVGDTATPFEHRLYGQEERLCQKYFYSISYSGAAFRLGTGGMNNTTNARITFPTPVTMRTVPTMTATNVEVRQAADVALAISGFSPSLWPGFITVTFVTSSPGTAGTYAELRTSAAGAVTFNAEL